MAGYTSSGPSAAAAGPVGKVTLVKTHSLDYVKKRKNGERLLRTLKHLIRKERVGAGQRPPSVISPGPVTPPVPDHLAFTLGRLCNPLRPFDLFPTPDCWAGLGCAMLPALENVETELREAEAPGLGLACSPAEEDMSLDHLLDVLTQLQYHTHQEEGQSVCWHFLVGACPNGDSCPQHHTALPYHWQLRQAASQRWESVQEDSQEMLERLYCDPEREKVTLSYRGSSFLADFGQMAVQGATFDRLRRLCTSETDLCNSFKTIWKHYWRDTFEWKEYTESVNQDFNEALQRGLSIRHVMVSRNQQYKVDLSAGFQQNISTGTKRRIRRRPLFQSIVTLLPYLKTLSGGPDLSPSVPSGNPSTPSPTSNSCQDYPETWIPMDLNVDFIKVPMALDDKAYGVVYRLFHKTMSETKFVILGIQRVQNQFLWDKYKRKKLYMSRRMTECERLLNEKHLFHGTSPPSIDGICKHNFDPRVSGRHATVYGQGSYFARKSSYSHRYARPSEEGTHYMFLSKVLVGRYTVGKPSMRRPPAIVPNNPSSDLFNSCVDSLDDPQIFVLFENDQCFPYFVVKYKEVEDSVAVS
ncbi:protein mono-ADP-ribosyltransferase TIPARP-like isoform X1 [Hypanus sabinus]|uniref:protein mono-ADP-ribosyltransferase TIPARP-like isoform X1 n=1 Tax=Hypanus sabinus TaxID=79690 RepID=UPI0028C446B6|nr:protein mono-ADP-ribosyltransferase TIPARP-like isoform X1 [Hypanus sabinus]